MYFLPYDRSLKDFSRKLRSHSTLSEVLLWQKLKANQFRGYGFNRQKPLDNYIVDFYCKRLELVIEIDGDSHFNEKALLNDERRERVLEEMGLHFFRVLDIEVKRQMPLVLNEINDLIDQLELEKGLERTFFI
jgi:very-short-patch-repair endonuclease